MQAVYRFVALLLLDAFITQQLHLQLIEADLAGLKSHKLICGKSGMLYITELFSITHSAAGVCLWRLHGYLLDFIQWM